MKKIYSLCIAALLGALFLGCGTTDYTLYLQDVTVKGPIARPPLHITNANEESHVRVTPHVEFNPRRNQKVVGVISGHSLVNQHGVFQVDTLVDGRTIRFREHVDANTNQFTGTNLTWRIPDQSGGVDLDIHLSQNFALSGGINWSTVDGQDLWGYSAGFAIISRSSSSALRFDLGLKWQELAYDALTVVITKQTQWFSSDVDERVGFFHDKGVSAPLDFYVGGTYNTCIPEWVVTPFMQVAFCRQALAKFQPIIQEISPGLFFPFPFVLERVSVDDMRASFSSITLGITPGVYLNLTHSIALVVGARINVQLQIYEASPKTIVMPMAQLDLTL
jgi:hypothetical protein